MHIKRHCLLLLLVVLVSHSLTVEAISSTHLGLSLEGLTAKLKVPNHAIEHDHFHNYNFDQEEDKEFSQLIKRGNVNVHEIFAFVVGDYFHNKPNMVESFIYNDTTTNATETPVKHNGSIVIINGKKYTSANVTNLLEAPMLRFPVQIKPLILERRSLKGLLKTSKKMGSLIKAISKNVVVATKKSAQVINKHFKKIAGLLVKIKNKIAGAVARTKLLYTKITNNAWVKFMRSAVKTVWAILPNSTKEWIIDQAIDYAIGKAGDIFLGMKSISFDADALMNDDEIEMALDSNKMNEFMFSDDDYDYSEYGDMDSPPKTTATSKKLHNSCCCGDKHSNKDDFVESIDIQMDDFTPDSLKGFENDTFDDIVNSMVTRSFATPTQARAKLLTPTRRNIIAKRCACANAVQSVQTRQEEVELALKQQKNRMLGKRNENRIVNPPSLMTGLTHKAAMSILNSANITKTGTICKDLNKPNENCFSMEKIRMGGLSGLLTLQLQCPICDIVILSAMGSHPNSFIDGWHFILKGTDTLSAFLSEVAISYDNDDAYYDKGKNRFTLVETGDDSWNWHYLVHI